MKLIIARTIRNNLGEKFKPLVPLENPSHIPKGTMFIVGGDLPLEKMKVEDREFVALLNLSGCIADGNDAERVKTIQLEAKQEIEAQQRAEKRIAAMSRSTLP